MSEGPIPWWPLVEGKRPLASSFAMMADEGLSAVGVLLMSHPTESEWEDIQAAFKIPGIDVIVITPLHWASLEQGCIGGRNVRWLNWPTNLFEMLYDAYGDEGKTIIVQTLESDWTVAGVGCDEADECVTEDGRFDFFFSQCESEDPDECVVLACNAVKEERAKRLLNVFNELQAAAMAARATHPDAKLTVLFFVEVNFFTDEFYLVARDLIWQMPVPPDGISLSLYRRAGDVVEAFNNVMEWTGLPPERIAIGEVGKREGTQPDGTVIIAKRQYGRITLVVNQLFELGAPFAIVWSWEEIPWTGGHTGRSVIDAVTGERLSGYAAIQELNDTWRRQKPRRGGRRVLSWTPTPTPTPDDPCAHCPPPDSVGCVISWPACVQCWEDCGQPIATPTPTITPTPTPTPTPHWSDSPLVTITAPGDWTHCEWRARHEATGQGFTGASVSDCPPFNISFPLVGLWRLEVVTHYKHEYEGVEVLDNDDIRGDVDSDGLYEYVNVKMIDVLAGPPD